MKLTRHKASAAEAPDPSDVVHAKPPVRVVVIDDHEMIVQSLVRLLAADTKIEVVGTSLNAVDGINIAARLHPDVVVIDYNLPDMEAPQAIKMLLNTVPGVKVVTLTGSESPGTYYVSMSSGSAAWVPKTKAIHELRTAILSVAAGRTYVSEDLEPRPPLDQLVVFYQPIIDFDDWSIVGFEALVRWQHPDLGLLQPDSFLPEAVVTGFVTEIDHWVLQQATHQLALWQGAHPRAPRLFVSVNVSNASASDPRLIESITEETQLAGTETSGVVVEIKESFLVDGPDETAALQAAFTAAGARLAVSDFGSSFSETSSVHHVPYDFIKIGQSIIRGLPGPSGTVWVVDDIVNVAQSKSTQCIAEGIEASGELEALRSVGVRFGQGFLFSPAVSATSAGALLAASLLPPSEARGPSLDASSSMDVN